MKTVLFCRTDIFYGQLQRTFDYLKSLKMEACLLVVQWLRYFYHGDHWLDKWLVQYGKVIYKLDFMQIAKENFLKGHNFIWNNIL